MWPNPKKTVDLVTFAEEILNGKLDFLCSVTAVKQITTSKTSKVSWVICNLPILFESLNKCSHYTKSEFFD